MASITVAGDHIIHRTVGYNWPLQDSFNSVIYPKNHMNTRIQALHGYIKRKGNGCVRKKLAIGIQGQLARKDGSSQFFGENAADFLVKSGDYEGVVIRITDEESMRSHEGFDEHSVTLTISQAKLLIAEVQNAIREIRKMARVHEKVLRAGV